MIEGEPWVSWLASDWPGSLIYTVAGRLHHLGTPSNREETFLLQPNELYRQVNADSESLRTMLSIERFHPEQFQAIEAALGALLFALVLSTLKTWKRLRHIPGPSLSWIGSSWSIKNAMTGSTSPNSRKLVRYGSLVRVGPNAVATDDPEVVPRISRSPNTRHAWNTGFRMDNGKDNLFTTLDQTLHDRVKAKTAYAMTGKDGVDLESGIDVQVSRLLRIIRTTHIATIEQHRVVDFPPLIRFFTSDAFTYLLFGKDFGFMDADDLYNVAKLNDQVIALLSLLCDLVWLRVAMQSHLLSFLQPKSTDEIGIGKIQGFVESHNFTGFKLRPLS